MQRRPNINIRFDTKAQVEKIKRAARNKKWSFNQFVIDSAEVNAEKLLETLKASEQLMVESNLPSLNQ